MLNNKCDNIGCKDISRYCCDVDTVNGCVKIVVYFEGHTKPKINNYCGMIR